MLRTYLKAKQICTIMLKRGDFKEKGGKPRAYFTAITLR